MVVLKYSKAKLVGTAVATLATIALYFALLLDPPHLRGSAYFLAHHPRLAPMIVGGLLVVVWRALSLALGDSAALEGTSKELVATNWWRTKRVPWRTITQVSAQRVRTRYGSHDQLVLLTVDDKVTVSLGCTEAFPGGMEALADAVDALRLAALQAPLACERPGAAVPCPGRSDPGHGGRFGAAATPAAAYSHGARPAFGRKGA
jgi:hypothetical protein